MDIHTHRASLLGPNPRGDRKWVAEFHILWYIFCTSVLQSFKCHWVIVSSFPLTHGFPFPFSCWYTVEVLVRALCYLPIFGHVLSTLLATSSVTQLGIRNTISPSYIMCKIRITSLSCRLSSTRIWTAVSKIMRTLNRFLVNTLI